MVSVIPERPGTSVLPTAPDPLDTVAALLRDIDPSTYVVYENGGIYAVACGVSAEITLTAQEITTVIDGRRSVRSWERRDLTEIQAVLEALPIERWRAYGWASFELAPVLLGTPPPTPDTVLLHLVVPRVEVEVGEGGAVLRRCTDAERDRLVAVIDGADRGPVASARPIDVRPPGSEEYHERVSTAIDEIRRRRLDKVILSRRVRLPGSLDVSSTYCLGRRQNTPARSFALRLGGVAAAGFSPETVVEVTVDGRVRTQPLAGTRALEPDRTANGRRRQELLSNPKEVFEHAISVRAATAELTPICEPDSIVVRGFMDIKERNTVQHLGSMVEGRLRPDCSTWMAFATLFPAVTASGIPKAAAYECIRRLESGPRGLYGGAVLTVDANGALDAALVLRTVFEAEGQVWLQAGAGVVAESTPEREFEETCEKMNSVAHCVVAEKDPR